jgi:hypothetical protein
MELESTTTRTRRRMKVSGLKNNLIKILQNLIKKQLWSWVKIWNIIYYIFINFDSASKLLFYQILQDFDQIILQPTDLHTSSSSCGSRFQFHVQYFLSTHQYTHHLIRLIEFLPKFIKIWRQTVKFWWILQNFRGGASQEKIWVQKLIEFWTKFWF